MEYIERINACFKDRPLFYVTRDGERAMSLEWLENYYIVANDSPILRAGKNILSVKSRYAERAMSTRELLEYEEVENFINDKSERPYILVFKNTPQIERICGKKGWILLNPKSELVDKLENKIRQAGWLEENCNEILIPSYKIGSIESFDYASLARDFDGSFIVQFNRGHTGLGTQLISDKSAWNSLVDKFPKREVKISEYIDGLDLTVNICVFEDAVIIGNPSFQITGVPELTDYEFSTVGNDWTAYSSNVNRDAIHKLPLLAESIGHNLAEAGWRGLAGLDFVLSTRDNKLYLIEINARQPASSVCESYLQYQSGITPTVMESHLGALLDIESSIESRIKNDESAAYIDGAQVFVRNIGMNKKLNRKINIDLQVGEYSFDRGRLEFVKQAKSLLEIDSCNYFIFPQKSALKYGHNDELARIQSIKRVVSEDGKLNEEILEVIKSVRGRVKP